MDTALSVDTLDDEKRPWNGSHAKRLPSMWLCFANGTRRAYHYGNLEGVDMSDGVLKIYFTTATVVCVGQVLDELGFLVGAEAAVYIREQHTSPFEVQPQDSYIARIEIQPPHPDTLTRKP